MKRLKSVISITLASLLFISAMPTQLIFASTDNEISESIPREGIRDWDPTVGVTYYINELVRWQGNIYRVRQTFTYWGDPAWYLGGEAHSLWELVSGDGGGGNGGDESETTPNEEKIRVNIVTNGHGQVFTETDQFTEGQKISLVATADKGYYLDNHVASLGELKTTNDIVFEYTVPHKETTLTFNFEEATPLGLFWGREDNEFLARAPINTFQALRDEDVVSFSDELLFLYAKGQLILVGKIGVPYNEIEAIVTARDGQIVGYLEVPNTYQIYFEGANEADLREKINEIEKEAGVQFISFNLVNEEAVGDPDRDEYDGSEEPPSDEVYYLLTGMTRVEEQELARKQRDIFNKELYGKWASYQEWVNQVDDYWIPFRGPVPSPTDEHWDKQWGLRAINIQDAWAFNDQIEQPVKIGILDSRFARHSDISEMTFFENNIPVRGAVESSTREYTTRISDGASHGTHVAGIIGADTNNEKGVAGIIGRFTTETGNEKELSQLYGYAVEGAVKTNITGSLNPVIHTDAFIYMHGIATLFAEGAQIINFSRGKPLNDTMGEVFEIEAADYWYKFEKELYSNFLMNYLTLGHEFVIVQSAGNESSIKNRINTRFNGVFINLEGELKDRIIVVGEMQEVGLGTRVEDYRVEYVLSNSSRIGERVDIVAPGAEIYSTVAGTSLSDESIKEGMLDDITNARYRYKSGTSMAAPMVSGVAGLVWGNNPELTGAQVKEIIVNNTLLDEAGLERTVFGLPEPTKILDANRAVRAAREVEGLGVNRNLWNTF